MSYSKIEIKTKGEAPSILTEVFIGGKKIKGVRSIRYEGDCMSRIPTVTLELNALDVTIDSPIAKFGITGDLKEIVFKDGEKVEFE